MLKKINTSIPCHSKFFCCYKQEVVFHYGSGKTNPMNDVKLHRNIKEASWKENGVHICINKNIYQYIFLFLITD